MIQSSFLVTVRAKENIQSHPYTPRPNISIYISNDTLILNKQKEKEDKPI